MLTIQDERDLLAAIYDGPFEQPLWSTFLERLKTRVQARYVGLTFRPPDRPVNSPIELFAGDKGPAGPRLLYRTEMYKRDPLPYLRLREGRVYSLAELLDENDPDHQAFLSGLYGPSGMSRMRMVRISEPGGVNAWLTVARPQPDFTASDGALLGALAPHVRRALRSYVAIERERMRADIAGDAMQRLNFGWISLDAKGRIVATSTHADRVLQESGHLRRDRHGRLTIADPKVDRALTEAVRACAEHPQQRPRALRVSRDPWVDMLLVPAERDPDAPAAPAVAVAIAYVQGDNRSAADRHEQIADLFGLLPSEARLALALSRGLSITEAAGELGLTVETARNYSKKIYGKLGARGQADLIRFILASVLALA